VQPGLPLAATGHHCMDSCYAVLNLSAPATHEVHATRRGNHRPFHRSVFLSSELRLRATPFTRPVGVDFYARFSSVLISLIPLALGFRDTVDSASPTVKIAPKHLLNSAFRVPQKLPTDHMGYAGERAMTTEIDVVDSNRRAWEEIAATHSQELLTEVTDNLQRDGEFYLEEPLRRALHAAGLSTSTVLAQFNCNNGRELISAVRHGAARGYGFDISTEYIHQATQLASQLDVDAQFQATDIGAIADEFDAVADIVFATASALCWMPDLHAYFATAHRVSREGGSLILYETHPFVEMFKADVDRAADEPLVPHYRYGTREPVEFRSEGAYFGDGNEGVTYWYHHSLSYIIQSALESGYTLAEFEEFGHDVCVGYKQVENHEVRPPLSMVLRFDRV
jgi:SAM-dependent methyltransferase